MYQRGFKTWCENTSLSFRKTLGFKKDDPLSPYVLAKHLNVPLLSPSDIVGLSQNSINLLLGSSDSFWSAVTIYSNNSELIIYNPKHSDGRQSNTLMHELSHIIIGHSPSQSIHSIETGIMLRNYNKDHEDEADWLAGALLLPRNALINIKWSGASTADACGKYTVSAKLLNWRLDKAGVNKMYYRANKKYSR